MDGVIRQSFRGMAAVAVGALMATACGGSKTRLDASAKSFDVEQDLGTDLSSGAPDWGTDPGFGAPDLGTDLGFDVPDAGCQEDKINFTPDNEPMYELYEVCIPEGDASAVAAVQAIDPDMSCGFGGFFAKCADNEVGCNGALETGPDKVVTEGQWKQICLLSILDAVSKIGGGHYL